MNSENIYTTLLSQSFLIEGRDLPLHGFSYQIMRDESGKVEIREHGWPTTITLYEENGPELADLTEEQVKARIEEVLS